MRTLVRASAALSLIAIGLLGTVAPAQAAPAAVPALVPALVPACPAHPAQLAGKHVTVAVGADDALLCANLKGAVLDGLDLTQFDLAKADLTGASLLHTKLIQADLTDATLTNAKFDYADLSQATLSGAHGTGISFVHADLTQATITGATFTSADFDHADLTQTEFKGGDLTGSTAKNATTIQTHWTNVKGKPSTSVLTDLAGSPFSVSTVVCIGAVIVAIVVVLLFVRAIRRAATRSARLASAYMATAYSPVPGQQPAPAAPTVPYQPPFQSPVQVPTTDLGDAVPAAYSPSSSFTTSDWQPPVVMTDNKDAQNVIQEVQKKKWFGRD